MLYLTDDAMAPPSWFRSALNRLSYLVQPVPLVSSVVVVILGVFIWEYVSHPEWFGTYSQEGVGPNEDIDLSGLTPEEQAAIADIDNLRLLLSDLGVGPEVMPNIQAIPEEGTGIQDSLLQNPLALDEPVNGQPLSGNSNPFDKYLSQYQFLGLSAQSLPPAGDTGTAASLSTSDSSRRTSTNPSNRDRRSPLEQALQSQAASNATTTAASNESNDEAVTAEGTTVAAQGADANGFSLITGVPLPQAATPGDPLPVLPTTLQTSPPPGTTGYTPPASLNLLQPSPAGTAAGAIPSGTSPLIPNSSGVPSATSQLNLSTPQVDVSNGSVVPTLPSATATPQVPELAPSPFSVPRPPGSFIGGGYINTFSNPTAPPE